MSILRQGGAGFRFDQRDVRAVEEAIEVQVFTVVRACKALAGLGFRLRDVGRIDEMVGACVADEHVHSPSYARECIARSIADAAQRDDQVLRIRDVGQIDNDLVRVGGDARIRSTCGRRGNRRCSLRHGGVAGIGNRPVKGVNQSIGIRRPRGAAFDAGRSVDRQRQIKVARSAMRLS